MNERPGSDDEAFGTGGGSGGALRPPASEAAEEAPAAEIAVGEDPMGIGGGDLIDAVADFMDDLVEVDAPAVDAPEAPDDAVWEDPFPE